MHAKPPTTVADHLRWYLGRDDIDADAEHVTAARPLALIGRRRDDLEGFADRLAPERVVLDVTKHTPSANELRALYAEHPETIVLAHRAERVITALGVGIAQPWYLLVSPLSARPNKALDLLRVAIAQLGVTQPLELLGPSIVSGLALYPWPRGLYELRRAAETFGAILESGSYRAAARSLAVSRQSVAKFVHRRVG